MYELEEFPSPKFQFQIVVVLQLGELNESELVFEYVTFAPTQTGFELTVKLATGFL